MIEIQDYVFRTGLIEGLQKMYFGKYGIRVFIKGFNSREFYYKNEKERDEEFERLKQNID